MAFTYSFQISDPIVIITMEGRMDQNGALLILESFTSDPAFRPHFGICFDVRKNNYLPVYAEISSFYHEYRRRYRSKIRGKVAFIVNSMIQFGVARMASTILSSTLPDMEVFISREEGLKWLHS